MVSLGEVRQNHSIYDKLFTTQQPANINEYDEKSIGKKEQLFSYCLARTVIGWEMANSVYFIFH